MLSLSSSSAFGAGCLFPLFIPYFSRHFAYHVKFYTAGIVAVSN
jgi:hypothetical protein